MNGLHELSRTLTEAQKALGSLDGELGRLSFVPDDPASIESAIAEMERIVDARVAGYASNPIVADLVTQMKERYREAIVQEAATARANGSAPE